MPNGYFESDGYAHWYSDDGKHLYSRKLHSDEPMFIEGAPTKLYPKPIEIETPYKVIKHQSVLTLLAKSLTKKG